MTPVLIRQRRRALSDDGLLRALELVDLQRFIESVAWYSGADLDVFKLSVLVKVHRREDAEATDAAVVGGEFLDQSQAE
ncbi:MAG TPA: hypothetical protein VM307_08270 [Egibacteraceae bacterium]|nr:hypothetical protein [Egibacteraceae bacterium]